MGERFEFDEDFDLEHGLGAVVLNFGDDSEDGGEGLDLGNGGGDDGSEGAGTGQGDGKPEKKPEEKPEEKPGAQAADDGSGVSGDGGQEKPATPDLTMEYVGALKRRVDFLEAGGLRQPAQADPVGDTLEQDYSGLVKPEEFDKNPGAAVGKIISEYEKNRQARETKDAEDAETTRAARERVKSAQDQSYERALETLPAFAQDPDIRNLYSELAKDPRIASDPQAPEKFARMITAKYPELAAQGQRRNSEPPSSSGGSQAPSADTDRVAKLEAENARLRRGRQGHMSSGGRGGGGGRKETGKPQVTDDHRAAARKLGLPINEFMELM